MTADIRAPRPHEMQSYYRAIPAANGLPSWEPADAAWYGGPEPWPPQHAPASPAQLDTWATADLDDPTFSPMAAFVDGECVGATGMISFGITVPGGSTLAAAGVSGTGVLATHRRRGHLSRMMQAMFDGALERAEPLAVLSASEASIYGRFGFGPATFRTRWEIARHEAALRPAERDPGSLHLVDAATARQAWPAVHAVVRARRVGELTPRPDQWDGLSDEPDGTNGSTRYLLHRDPTGRVDGIAHLRLPWSATADHVGTLVVDALEATDPAAYRALWSLLLDWDLTRTVVAPGRPRDEPLRWMLANPRALRVTRQSDNLWVRVLDVPAALTARSYAVDDRLVLGIADDPMCPGNVGTWCLESSDGMAVCGRVPGPADLMITPEALGSAYLGGVSIHDLAYAGLVRTDEPELVDRLARMLRVDPEPHNSFGF